MSLATQKKHPAPALSSEQNFNSSDDPIGLISKRQSKDIVIGLCGAIGSGVKSLRSTLEQSLTEHGYTTHHILVSDLIQEITGEIAPKDPFKRYDFFQDLGDILRSSSGYRGSILAEAAIKEIAKIRQNEKPKTQSTDDIDNPRAAFIIDQLKNPQEIKLLRLVYQNNFYLVGSLRELTERKRNLRDEGIKPEQIDKLIHKDKASNEKTGQQTAKTILDADYFIKNNHSHLAELKSKLNRFIGLIHGQIGISPSVDEKGMYAAFSASLQSSCLSRQVGAAILSDKGSILATGRNDVPKAGGGLYLFEDKDKDYRCVHKGGKCYNDYHKQKISKKITSILEERINERIKTLTDSSPYISELANSLNIGESSIKEILQLLKSEDFFSEEWLSDTVSEFSKSSSLGSLIEFSRAIHAEMDAITSLARLTSETTVGKTMYTTTYPCHNCARHIVAAGLEKVIYIEPYDKSLALDLHDDAIAESVSGNETNKVIFQMFEGVSPRRYQKFFFSKNDRKDGQGAAYQYEPQNSLQIDLQLLESYRDYEDRVVKEYQAAIDNSTFTTPKLSDCK